MTWTCAELLLRLRELGETSRIETKRGCGKAVRDTISAFANEPDLGGGWLLFGVVWDDDDPTAYREMAGVDTHTASQRLRRLRDLGVLEQQGASKQKTYYTLASRYSGGEPVPVQLAISEAEPVKPPKLETQSHKLEGKSPKLNGQSPMLDGKSPEFRKRLASLGRRPDRAVVDELLVELCQERPWSKEALASLLGRRPDYLMKHYLARLVSEGRLTLLYPDRPRHPAQAYVAAENEGGTP